MSASKKQLHAILRPHQSQFTRCIRPTLRKGFFAIETAPLMLEISADRPDSLSTRTDNGCLERRASFLTKPPPQSVLVSVALATYAALQGDAHG
jgi:hypothetical protein